MLKQKYQNPRTSMMEKADQKASATISSIHVYFLEQAFLHDQTMRDFLVECRILLSFIYFDKDGSPDETLLDAISQYCDQNFANIFVEKYESAIQNKLALSKQPSFFIVRRESAFRRSFIETFKAILRNKKFRFSIQELLSTVDNDATVKLTITTSLFFYIRQGVTQIDRAQNIFPIATILNSQRLKLRELIKSKHSISGTSHLANDAKYILIIALMLYLGDVSSSRSTIIFAASALVVATVTRIRLNYLQTEKHEKRLGNLIKSLNVIEYVKKTTFRVATLQRELPRLEIIYQEPKRSSEINSSSEPSCPVVLNRPEIKRYAKKVKLRYSGTDLMMPTHSHSFFRPKENKSVKKTEDSVNIIDFSDILGYVAIYNSRDLENSNLFPVRAFGLPNFFACIHPELVKHIEEQDTEAAKKFDGLIRSPKILGFGSYGIQGIKCLNNQFIKLGEDEISACYELKIVGKQGDKRLLGYAREIENGGVLYNIISFTIFLPNAHQNKSLERSLLALEKSANFSSIRRI